MPMTADFVLGGIVWSTALPAAQSFSLEVVLRVRGGGSEDWVTQVFVTEDPEVSAAEPDGAARELVWSAQGRGAQVVLPGGRVVSVDQPVRPAPEPLLVRIAVNQQWAIVDGGGQRAYSGLHELDGHRPRYVGVRFMHRGKDRNAPVSVESIRVRTPQRP
jgi:hypothetical protein